MNSSEWNGSEIAWILAEVPLAKRQAAQDAGVISVPALTVYHVTDSANVASIKTDGIKAQSSRQSYDRPEAAYFFVIRDEIDGDALAILGIENPVILTVNIPAADGLTKMQWDGLYNTAFYTASAVQYFDNVPASWID